jgi:uncharacterized protein (DUF2384 family)
MAERTLARALPEERDPLLAEIEEVVEYPEIWLDTPNTRFGGMRPRDLLNTEQGRQLLHSVVQAVKYGMFT